MRKLRSATALCLAFGLLTVGMTASAATPAPVGLGTAGSYAVLAGTPNITNSGPSVIAGNVGIDPAISITGFPPGTIIGDVHTGDAVSLQAKADLGTAYDNAAGRPVDVTVAGGELGGLTLVGGVYNAGGVTLDLTGTLTLDGENNPDAVWIFQATSDLNFASSSTINFVRGGQACNVFWQVSSSANLGSASNVAGTIMALASITMQSGVTLAGRALARNGTVTLINDAITTPTCASAPAPTPTPTPTVAPTPTPTPTAAPTATPTAAPTATPTAAPTATPTAAPTATPTGAPTAAPTATPTNAPTTAPTAAPTSAPTAAPSSQPGSPTSTPTPTNGAGSPGGPGSSAPASQAPGVPAPTATPISNTPVQGVPPVSVAHPTPQMTLPPTDTGPAGDTGDSHSSFGGAMVALGGLLVLAAVVINQRRPARR